MNIIQRLGVALKAAASSFVMSFGRVGGGWGGWQWSGAGDIDFAAAVGSGRGNSIVAATLNWLGKKFPNGVLSIRKITKDGYEDVPVHPLLTLMRRPTQPENPYSGAALLKAVLADWTITGNAYMIKVRNSLDSPVQLWYAPSFMMEPVSKDPTVFIQYYEYSPGGERSKQIRTKDVVHLRNGIDPDNVRKGLSPLGAIIREIYTDSEASLYTAAMLKNQGIPGVVISPEDESEIPPDAADEIKKSYMAKFTGAKRGEPLVLGNKVKVTRLAFSPEEMALGSVRDIPEERITAVLGLPAVVVGMGSGLDSATYSNLANLKREAIEDNLLPTYMDFAEQFHTQLMPEFETDIDQWDLYFDLSGVRELQPDLDKMVERETRKLLAGGITLATYLKNVGEDPIDGAESVMYVPVNVVPTAVDAIVPVPLALPAPTPIRAVAGLDGGMAIVIAKAAEYEAEMSHETKALGVMQSIVRLRARLLDPETRALARLLRKQLDQTISVLDDVVKDAGSVIDVETKETDPAVFAARLESRLRSTFEKGTQTELERLQLRAALGTHELVAEWAGIDIPVDARLRARYLREAGKNVTGITDYTLEALNKTIRASVFGGETIEETTARIRGLHVFSDARAATIVATELSIATNRAAIVSYRESGIVERVRVHDGTDHDEPCASLNGREFSLDEAAGIPEIGHPRCVRRFEPLTRAEARGLSNGHVDHKELVAV